MIKIKIKITTANINKISKMNRILNIKNNHLYNSNNNSQERLF